VPVAAVADGGAQHGGRRDIDPRAVPTGPYSFRVRAKPARPSRSRHRWPTARERVPCGRRFPFQGGKNMLVGWSILLIIHGILAVFLLGATSHQAIGAVWPVAKRTPGFVSALRSTSGVSYTNAIVVLFIVTAILGTIIYPTYRLNVRTILQEYKLYRPEGSFELKEHFVAIGFMLLPAYWYFWHKSDEATRTTRTVLSVLLALIVWWGFLVGHVINNIRGFGS
jgi:hypothetical protein